MQRAPCNVGLLGFSEKTGVTRSCFSTILYPRALAASYLPLLGELSGYEIAYGDTVMVKLGSHLA